ncbi:MAG: hypothetical protein WC659_05240 [Patescibacteria group bacterium]
MAEEAEKQTNAGPITVSKDVLDIVINEAIRPLARHLVMSLPDDVLKDRARLWSMATPALAFAVARALPDKGVWKTVDIFQKEFFSEVGQALRDRASGMLKEIATHEPKIAHLPKAEAVSFGLVFTTLGRTSQGVAVLKRIGSYGGDGLALYAHFAGIPAAQLEQQLRGLKPEAVDALMLTFKKPEKQPSAPILPKMTAKLDGWKSRARQAADKYNKKKGWW